jgi:xanthine dehydrogenase YagS FAD-binding subunit
VRPFAYAPIRDVAAATARAAAGAEFIAGGTDMLQLLQEGVRAPAEIADLNALGLSEVNEAPDGALHLGALARLQEVADHPGVRARVAAVAEALDATASPMVRHMATVGGNLLQRTRCLYFRDVTTPCNKRVPGSGCPAQDGENRINAILGGSEHCIAVQPSDLPVALIAADAEVLVRGPDGAERAVPMEAFHLLPGDTPHIETVLQTGDIVTAICIPAAAAARRSHYVKVRDRASFAWSLASCAVSLRVEEGRVAELRVAAGGVATKPWRLPAVEEALLGKVLAVETIARAADRATEGGAPRAGNAYKVPLLRNTVERALLEIGGLA